MLVAHSFNQREMQKEVEQPRLMLTNGSGSYLLLGEQPETRYEGFFFYDQEEQEMYRIIEDIRLGSRYALREIIDHTDFTERLHQQATELFHMPKGVPGFLYELDRDLDIQLFLDGKRSYDNRDYGRYYEIAKEGDSILVTFIKRTDPREDGSDGKEEYRLYLVIYAEDLDFSFINHWTGREYTQDRKRGSLPDRRYVLDALRLRVKRAVFYAGKDKKECYREAKKLYRSHIDLRDTRRRHDEYDGLKDHEHKLALYRARRSVRGNLIQGKDLFAGLPWFFQYWARDTAIALPALLEIGEKETAERLILQAMGRVDYEGYIPNRQPTSPLGSADAVGIFADRLGKLLKAGGLQDVKQRRQIRDRLQHACYLLRKFKTKDGLAVNKEKETWMDTDPHGEGRAGMRIEIQALRMRLYEVLHELTDDPSYELLIHDMRKKVRKRFLRKGKLQDAPDDPAQRPNVFLAAYFFPRLFPPKQWRIIFDHALSELWLEWGGLATLAKSHPDFKDAHTGEDNRSYHQGDSWYYLNNIAAIVMHRIDKHRYQEFIESIVDASTRDLLWGGALGHASELSSAGKQTHEGCLSQTWSASTYIELIHELHLLKA